MGTPLKIARAVDGYRIGFLTLTSIQKPFLPSVWKRAYSFPTQRQPQGRPYQQYQSTRFLHRSRIRCALQIQVVSVGRKSQKEAWCEEPVEEYVKRLKGGLGIDVDMLYVKDDDALMQWFRVNGSHGSSGSSGHQSSKDREEKQSKPTLSLNSSYVIAMDERGNIPRDSNHFSDLLFSWLEKGGSRVAFVIGGADGLPEAVKKDRDLPLQQRHYVHYFLSLSNLTFTHKLARLLLVEQIYRAAEIRKGSKYNK